MIISDSEGRSAPFFIDDVEYHSVASTNFSPFEDPSLTSEKIGSYIDGGFLVMPHADGTFYGITWRAFVANGKKFTIAAGGKANLIPSIYKGKDSEWIPCRFVKVYSHADGTYASACSTMNIGL